MKLKKNFLLFALSLAGITGGAVTPGPGAQYASDAYPGFDNESNILDAERKTPSFFWWRRAECKDPKAQLELARGYAAANSCCKAAIAYNALVASSPFSTEAVTAQEELADLYLYRLADPIEAFEEYKYLLEFYSTNCDYNKVVSKLYEAAKKMREDGKRIVYFRFANTSDVRRAFEHVVRRASGMTFAPEAMYAIVELRIDDEEYEEAVEVCKMLRNRYNSSFEAKKALCKEAELRMLLLRRHDYNRDRSLNTVSFMDMAAKKTDDAEARERFLKWRDEVSAIVERRAYESARFYDSVTRKPRGAINAYESFLRDFPAGRYAQTVRARLAVLKSKSTVKESR